MSKRLSPTCHWMILDLPPLQYNLGLAWLSSEASKLYIILRDDPRSLILRYNLFLVRGSHAPLHHHEGHIPPILRKQPLSNGRASTPVWQFQGSNMTYSHVWGSRALMPLLRRLQTSNSLVRSFSNWGLSCLIPSYKINIPLTLHWSLFSGRLSHSMSF
jgi:hypothetical protein